MDNKTYTSYHLTVDIPDVACEKCTLQLLNVMTDKTHWCNLTVRQGWWTWVCCVDWGHGEAA